jgi:hypothetical protein
MTSAWVGGVVAVLAVLIIGWLWVPRQPRVKVTSAEIDADFSRESRDREELFHHRIRGWGYVSLLIGLVVPAALTASGMVTRVLEKCQAGQWGSMSAP